MDPRHAARSDLAALGVTIGRPGCSPPRSDSMFADSALALAGSGTLDILDAGCGHAWLRPLMAKAGHRYTGLDSDPYYADVEGSVDDLPFAPGSFDAVLCRSVLQYLATPANALDEFYRVLRPGGFLLCSVPFLEPWMWEGLIHFTPKGIITLATRAGFRVTHIHPLWSLEEAMREAATKLGAEVQVDLSGVGGEDRLRFAASLMIVAIRDPRPGDARA